MKKCGAWKRINKGWGNSPIWILKKKPKAILKRHGVYGVNFMLIVYDVEKTNYEFQASNLMNAKIKAVEIYNDNYQK